MREVTISREPHRLHGPLSAKIAQMRTRFRHARTGDIAILPEEMDALFENLDEMVGEARKLEQVERHEPASVACIAYHLVAQVGDELLVLRSLLAEMMHTPQKRDDDCSEQIVCAFARARALLEKGEAVFVGKAKS